MRLDDSEVIIEIGRIRAAGRIGTRKMRSLGRHHLALLETKVKRNAHDLFGGSVTAGGHPLSRPHTGDYGRSITREITDTPGGFTGDVFTNAVQGARLEYGFVGVDSLDRHYNQPPFPHFRPAADETETEFVHDVELAAETLLSTDG